MAVVYLLLALLPIAALAYIVWDHRRKAAQREAASAARMQELLGVAAANPAPAQTSDAAGATAAAAAEAPPAKRAGSYEVRQRVLTPPQTLLYYLLRTGLPDYVVFAQLPVASVLDAPADLAPYAREEQARIFARHVVDFVVVDKSTRPVAVVKLTTTGDTHQSAVASLRSWFTGAGVRYVEIDSASLPRKEAVRSVVLGEGLSSGEQTNTAFSSEREASAARSDASESRSPAG